MVAVTVLHFSGIINAQEIMCCRMMSYTYMPNLVKISLTILTIMGVLTT